MLDSHRLVCWVLVVILPTLLVAQDTNAAILHTRGGDSSVNGNPVPATISLFVNDFVQIPKGATARIQSTGFAADIDSESVLQFEDDELALEHGSLSMYTNRGTRVRVGCLTVTPVNPTTETLYEVVDRDGSLTVHATKGEVYIDRHSSTQRASRKSLESGRDLVREGERRSREDKCAVAANKGQPAGSGAILNSQAAKWGAAGAAVGVTCWFLCRNDQPASPAKP